MDRDGFYNEQLEIFKETGKPTRAVEVVQTLLFSPDGEILLQKRSRRKNHNPGMLDKTMGGHITFGDSSNYTVMAETLQELEVPSFVLPNEEDFKKTFKLLRDYTNTSAIVQFVDSKVYNSKKIMNKELVEIANKYYFYLGVYNGSIRPSDKEAAGVLFYNYDIFLEEMAEEPESFTHDLRFFINKYSTKIKQFLAELN